MNIQQAQSIDVRPLVDECEAARWLGVQPGTLQRWRWEGRGPVFVRVGRRAVRYEPRALEHFIAEGRRSSTRP
jgi:hypothetical protein